MQKKIHPTKAGFAVIFKKDALQFVRQWRKPITVHKSWVDTIEIMAADPAIFVKRLTQDFAGAYEYEPDLAAALLNFMRRKWANLEKSKAGKLKKFIATTPAIKSWRGCGAKRVDRNGMVSKSDLQDGELATAFQNSTDGKPVTTDDVVKARRWVAANIKAGEKYAKKNLDKDGYLHVKGKTRRRK